MSEILECKLDAKQPSPGTKEPAPPLIRNRGGMGAHFDNTRSRSARRGRLSWEIEKFPLVPVSAFNTVCVCVYMCIGKVPFG